MDYEELFKGYEQRLLLLEEFNSKAEGYMNECSIRHEQVEKLALEMQEHNRRSEDALNHNTQSNLLLIESNEEAIKSNEDAIRSNRELAVAFTLLKEHIEKEHDPVINWYKPFIPVGEDFKGFFRTNRRLGNLIKWFVYLVIGLGAFIGAISAIKAFL